MIGLGVERSIVHCPLVRYAVEERRKAALDALFRTLLHHLMTGKVRVRGALLKPEE